MGVEKEQKEKDLCQLLEDSLNVQYLYGVSMRKMEPHWEADWRSLPYHAVVMKGDSQEEYIIETKRKGVIHLPANSVFIIPAGEPFNISLKVTAYLGNAHLYFTIFGHIDILSFYNVPCLIQEPASLEIMQVINELAACTETLEKDFADIYYIVRKKRLSFQLLELLMKQAGVSEDFYNRLTDMDRMRGVINHMNRHMAENISRKDLAHIVNLSETRFHYVFCEIMGTSPMNYLMMLRLREAQKLLLETNDSITSIAEAVGIGNVSYFCKLFKKKFDVSPLKYRQMKENH